MPGELLEYTRQIDALREKVNQLTASLEKVEKKTTDVGNAGQRAAKGMEAGLKAAAATIAATSTGAFQEQGISWGGIGNAPLSGSASTGPMAQRLANLRQRQLAAQEKITAAQERAAAAMVMNLTSGLTQRGFQEQRASWAGIQNPVLAGTASTGAMAERLEKLRVIRNSIVEITQLEASGVAIQQRRNALLEVEKVTQKQILAQMQGLSPQTIHRPGPLVPGAGLMEGGVGMDPRAYQRMMFETDRASTAVAESSRRASRGIRSVGEAGQFASPPIGVAALETAKFGNSVNRARIVSFQLTSGLQDIAIVLQGGGGVAAAARAASNNIGLLASTMKPVPAILATVTLIGLGSLVDVLAHKFKPATDVALEAFKKLQQAWRDGVEDAKRLADAAQRLFSAQAGYNVAVSRPDRQRTIAAEQQQAAMSFGSLLRGTRAGFGGFTAEEDIQRRLTEIFAKQPGGTFGMRGRAEALEVSVKEQSELYRFAKKTPPHLTAMMEELLDLRKSIAEKGKVERAQSLDVMSTLAKTGDLSAIPEGRLGDSLRRSLEVNLKQITQRRLGLQAAVVGMTIGQAVGAGMGGGVSSRDFDTRQLQLQREIMEMERPFKQRGRAIPFRIRQQIEGKRMELEDLGLQEREVRARERSAKEEASHAATIKSEEWLHKLYDSLATGIHLKNPAQAPDPGRHGEARGNRVVPPLSPSGMR